MTNATKLADALVDAGILHFDGDDIEGGKWYGLGLFRQKALTMINDWRVAGKCLELPNTFGAIMNAAKQLSEQLDCGLLTAISKILQDPLSIIEAWYTAQENEQ